MSIITQIGLYPLFISHKMIVLGQGWKKETYTEVDAFKQKPTWLLDTDFSVIREKQSSTKDQWKFCLLHLHMS
jgi:hypothetical protein